MIRSLFVVDGDALIPSELTRGGWSDEAQHGSPPAGIMARAIERVPTAGPMQVVRFTIDLFREVPLAPLRIETEVIRDGRRIQVVEARLFHDDRELGRATALKIRVAEQGGDELRGTRGEDPLPTERHPEDLPLLDLRSFFGGDETLLRFHTDAIEIRSSEDSFVRPVVGESWFRLKVDLVEGETVTPLQRAAIMSDLSNGNSQALDPKRWLYVNPDTTLYLHRLPDGEWVGMRSWVDQVSTGIGVNESAVYDLKGRFGHINQAQLIERR